MTKQEIYEKAIETYGVVSQTDMVIEEMAELIIAIMKLRRAEKAGADIDTLSKCLDNLAEETGDVEITTEQLKKIYDIEYEVNESVKSKIKRLEERLNG